MSDVPVEDRSSRYAQAGVDIAAGERAVELIKGSARSTFGPRVFGDLGAFGGLFALGGGYRDPVLVSSTDGVGTKLKIAIALDRHHTIGRDLVAHCVDDVLTTGAEPLFFLDYLALGRLVPERVAAIVDGIAGECRANGCALVGGETAEMPDLYAPDDYDLAGFIVGVVERDRIVDGSKIRPGDHVWGLDASGLHTNGYSLARKALADLSLDAVHPALGRPLGDVLLDPHRSYLEPMRPLLAADLVRGMAHVTGGGIVGNVPRILPPDLGVDLEWSSWPVPPIFDLIQQLGDVSFDEMTRVFNLGLGWVFMAAETDAEQVRELVPEARPIGRVVERVRNDAAASDRVRLLGAP
jgi:phosphoribosylformylglycinamidine cyclo-ligase